MPEMLVAAMSPTALTMLVVAYVLTTPDPLRSLPQKVKSLPHHIDQILNLLRICFWAITAAILVDLLQQFSACVERHSVWTTQKEAHDTGHLEGPFSLETFVPRTNTV